jgi:hypothetical protein
MIYEGRRLLVGSFHALRKVEMLSPSAMLADL